MKHIIKITRHTSDPELVMLHTPPEIAGHMGRLEAARYDTKTKTYLLTVEALPGLYAMASYLGIHIHDQRENPVANQVTIPQECRHCATPAKANGAPTYCPGCGRIWDPVGPPIDADPDGIHRTACDDCGRRQSGRFPHCSNCGAAMVYPLDEPGRVGTEQLRLELANRPHRDEPIPLSAAIEDLAEDLATRMEDA